METGYEITDTWDEFVEAMLEVVPTTLEGVNQRVTELATTVRQENEESQRGDVCSYTWTSSEDMSAAIEAHVRILEAHVATLIAHTSSIQTQLTTTLGRVVDVLAERDADRSINGYDNHDSGISGGRQTSSVRECTYTDFLKCQPMNFKGTEGVKFATCTLQGNALTWLNSHVRVFGHDIAYAMPWKTLKKMMIDKYCPRGEIKKMFPEESDVVEKYVGGLPDMIHGSVKASKPNTMQEAIEFATDVIDKKILTITERQAENKRKFEDAS
ncbi:hypothetical protein Tco_0545743 [Tanacetum coccineum]